MAPVPKVASGEESLNTPTSASAPLQRWDLLRQALTQHSTPNPEECPASKRLFTMYPNILEVICENDAAGFTHIQMQSVTRKCNLKVLSNQKAQNFGNLEELASYDRTGRICVWPAEQIAAYWCLKNVELFRSSSVLELGGGFHCLAALTIAKSIKVNQVVLSDGDVTNQRSLVETVMQNNFPLSTHISTATLRWDQFDITTHEHFLHEFDYVIGCDLLYDDNAFDFPFMLDTIAHVLRPGGVFLLFNPTRGNLLNNFCVLAEDSGLFESVEMTSNYDKNITRLANQVEIENYGFKRDWHYPLKVVLKASS